MAVAERHLTIVLQRIANNTLFQVLRMQQNLLVHLLKHASEHDEMSRIEAVKVIVILSQELFIFIWVCL